MKKVQQKFFPLGVLLTAVFLMAAVIVYLCAFDPNITAYVGYIKVIMVFQVVVMLASYLLLLMAALPRGEGD